jgi:hypothetical protein
MNYPQKCVTYPRQNAVVDHLMLKNFNAMHGLFHSGRPFDCAADGTEATQGAKV